MKRSVTLISFILFAGISLFAQKTANILKQSEGSITFVVDENLPAPRSKHVIWAGEEHSSALLFDEYGIPENEQKVVTASYLDEEFSDSEKDIFFRSFVNAFGGHKPLVLSPDMVWLIISQGFGHYVNENAEALRSQFVGHADKMTLTVQTDKDMLKKDADWQTVIDGFQKQIADNTKGDIANTLTSDFSTTTRVEHVASGITLMDAVKPYFRYKVVRISCGIPNITVKGTPDDWKKVLSKTKILSKYGLDWWVNDLTPILKQFIKASEGKPNQTFWKDIVMKEHPERLRGGCGSGSTELDGWFLKFFPFCIEGRTPEAVPHDKSMLPEMVKVPFVYQVVDPISKATLSETNMELWAGFVGASEDIKTHAITPKIGWLVRVANDSISNDSTTNPESLEHKIKDPSETHEYVDLGLSVKWATCNVGASSPEEYGDYFAWGETAPQTNNEYSWASYKWCNGSATTITKYCTNHSYGTVDNLTTLELSDDAAHVNWGGSWRMPTAAELKELQKCSWIWTKLNGVDGYKVVGTNGNYIFLPATGARHDNELDRAGTDGWLWSSSLCWWNVDKYAYRLTFNSKEIDWYHVYDRYYGRSVRPVCP